MGNDCCSMRDKKPLKNLCLGGGTSTNRTESAVVQDLQVNYIENRNDERFNNDFVWIEKVSHNRTESNNFNDSIIGIDNNN